MKAITELPGDLRKSALWTALLTLLFLLFYAPANALTEMIIALPFFIVFYYCFSLLVKIQFRFG